jgi:Holliday junction resolvase RusA-like endonuclease
MIEIIIPGVPISWKRAGRNQHRYIDLQKKEKERIQELIRSYQIPLLRRYEGLKVIFEYDMPIPASWSLKRQKEAVGKPHISRPDIDNFVKFTSDTLNTFIWEDDAQIFEIKARKLYSVTPKTRILIEKAQENPRRDIYL